MKDLQIYFAKRMIRKYEYQKSLLDQKIEFYQHKINHLNSTKRKKRVKKDVTPPTA